MIVPRRRVPVRLLVVAALCAGLVALPAIGAAAAEAITATDDESEAVGPSTPDWVATCATTFKPDVWATIYVSGPSGQLITINNQPGDPDWQQAVTRSVGADMDTLRRLIGTPMPFAELTVQQTAEIRAFGGPGDLRPDEACLLMPGTLDSPAVPAVALARTWFNDGTIADAWLREGLVMWSGHRVTGTGCPMPASAAAVSLSPWSGDTAQAALACSVIAEIATRLGPYRMTSVLTAFVTDTAVYGDEATSRGTSGPIDQHHFLDAVDELGLILADEPDLEWAESRLLAVGAIDADELEGRAKTRALYHDALGRRRGGNVPDDVHELMGAWRFEEAADLLEKRRG